MSSGAHSRGWFRPGYGPHPEELAKQASRRMDAKQGLAAILRDGGRGALERMRSVSFKGSFARNDGNSRHNFTIPPRDAPEPLMNLPPKEGVGNAGCPLHPRPRVHLVVVERTRVTTSTPESPGIPRAMVLTVSFVLLVTGLFCHRRLRIGLV